MYVTVIVLFWHVYLSLHICTCCYVNQGQLQLQMSFPGKPLYRVLVNRELFHVARYSYDNVNKYNISMKTTTTVYILRSIDISRYFSNCKIKVMNIICKYFGICIFSNLLISDNFQEFCDKICSLSFLGSTAFILHLLVFIVCFKSYCIVCLFVFFD